MSTYTPDRWAVVEFDSEHGKIRKVLASWYGGYTGGDSWKLSSGITRVDDMDNRYEFLNESGSLYICYKHSYGMSGYTSSIYANWLEQLADHPGATVELVEEYKSQG